MKQINYKDGFQKINELQSWIPENKIIMKMDSRK